MADMSLPTQQDRFTRVASHPSNMVFPNFTQNFQFSHGKYTGSVIGSWCTMDCWK
jgi:hypothetical protein